MTYRQYDVIVVGSGIAGLYATLKAAQFARVCLITKGKLQDTNTYLAQGGIAASLGDDDTPLSHMRDTLVAGAGACNPQAVAVLVEEGPQCVRQMLAIGTPFDYEQGCLALTREGAHSKNRVLHCGGDATGRLMQDTLQQRIVEQKNVKIRQHTFVTDLLTQDGRVCGVRLLSGQCLYASTVILATGGLGQVYDRTTNPVVATGDGVAIAHRAGAQIADMEFIQFHPTVFQGKSEEETFLISEAVRGEGAVLRNSGGQQFMSGYHPLADLGPRDVVARAILDQIQTSGSAYVYLDITHRSEDFLQNRFPTIYQMAKQRGFDMAKQWLPVAPAAHYAMGGVVTGLDGQSSLAGLYACGEVACSGVHGANRLASNSLLEGLVFAQRAVNSIKKSKQPKFDIPRIIEDSKSGIYTGDVDKVRHVVRQRMFEDAGLLRDGSKLLTLRNELMNYSVEIPAQPLDQKTWELKNLLTVAELIVAGALTRTESRGGHFRMDYPQMNPTFTRYDGLNRAKEETNRAPVAV